MLFFFPCLTLILDLDLQLIYPRLTASPSAKVSPGPSDLKEASLFGQPPGRAWSPGGHELYIFKAGEG